MILSMAAVSRSIAAGGCEPPDATWNGVLLSASAACNAPAIVTASPCPSTCMYMVAGSARRRWLCKAVTSMPPSWSFFMTGLISSSVMTRSPITMAALPAGAKASQPPSAKPGLIATLSTLTLRSVRQRHAIDATRLHRTLLAERLADGAPVGIGGKSGRGAECRDDESGNMDGARHGVSSWSGLASMPHGVPHPLIQVLRERDRRSSAALGEAPAHLAPSDRRHEGVDISGRLGAVIHVIGVFIHVECQDRLTSGERMRVVRRPVVDEAPLARGPAQRHPARAAAERPAHGGELGAPTADAAEIAGEGRGQRRVGRAFLAQRR